MGKTLQEKIDDIHLEIPKEFFVVERQDKIDFSLLEGKTLVGLLGYAKSGKDTIAETLSSKYGYHKIKFGDALKKVLNNNFKEIVFEDLQKKGEYIEFSQIDFLIEDDRIIKEKLRPYMIWLAETLRRENGVHYWTNKALKAIHPDVKKIVGADFRRSDELDFFRGNYNTIKREWNSCSKAGMVDKEMRENFEQKEDSVKTYSTNLFLVNQYDLKEEDSLTKETILLAIHEWLIDGVVNVDSRIPDEGDFRKTFMENTVTNLAIDHKL